MGVPGLFKYVSKKFYKRIRAFYFGEFTTSVDYLYLDANGLLHGAAQKIFKYGSYEGEVKSYYSYESALYQVYSLFFEELKRVISIVMPKKVLYIAIDGPAPRAKQDQQRQRRFDSSKVPTDENPFTSNVITPGTEFMAELTRYVNFAIRKLLNVESKLEVIFSPQTQPGEGEHKIMDYIRALPDKEKLDSVSHCIFGPDADLIMLGLATHLQNIYLFKEDQFEPDHYYYLDIAGIRSDMPIIMRLTKPRYTNKQTYDIIADEFIILGFFVGNDFLPKIQMFHNLQDGLAIMLNTFYQTSNAGVSDRLIVQKDGLLNLNLKGFRKFVSKLEESEVAYLINQVTTSDPAKQPPGKEYVNNTLINNMYRDASGKAALDFKRYADDYYEKSHIKTNEEINAMCESYIKSFIWIYIYYTRGCPAWQWAYTYHYAPLMRDLKHYLEKMTEEDFEKLGRFSLGKPLLPFEQLLAVLPPSSRFILPEEYRGLFVDEDSILVKEGYFPKEMIKDYEGKLKEHEAHLILPFVDPEVIRKAYHSVTKVRPYVRNSVGGTSKFKYDARYTSVFTSDMGNIPSCHVKKIAVIGM